MADKELTQRLGHFVPAWWCRSGHAQTIWASAIRPAGAPPGLQREQWNTDDGDFLDLDHVPADAGRPVLLILHGLEGSSRAQQVCGLLHAAHRRRWRAFALNFRSCSGEANRLRRSYHAGETADLDWVLRHLSDRFPQHPMACVGMSLGANVLLKYLGERLDVPPALIAAAAISAPFDLAASARTFEQGVLNRVYMRRLLNSLKRKTSAKLKCYPDLIDPRKLAAVRTIREFDELVTAPLNGFADADAYWSASSCRQFLRAIRRPTLLISSFDDPLVPALTLPHEEVADNPRLTATFHDAGGHVGFISGVRPSHPVVWTEHAVFTFFEAISARKAQQPSETGRTGPQ